MDSLSGPLSKFIISTFQGRFPAVAEDPAMTTLSAGLIAGLLISWFLSHFVYKGIINGLKGTNDILSQYKEFLDHQLKELRSKHSAELPRHDVPPQITDEDKKKPKAGH